MGKLSSALKVGKQVAELGKNAKNIHEAASTFRAADKRQMGRSASQFAFSEGAAHGKTMGKTWLKTFEVIPRLVLRGLQLVAALIICGFYGNRVDVEKKANQGIAPEWLYGVTIAGMSAVTAIFFTAAASAGAIPFLGSRLKLLKAYRAYPWDITLFLAWIVAFGVFAGLFLKREDNDSYRGSNTGAMKIAMWIDVVNAVLWFFSAAFGCFKTLAARKADKLTDKVGKKMFGGDAGAV